jgi:hypothetical protein
LHGAFRLAWRSRLAITTAPDVSFQRGNVRQVLARSMIAIPTPHSPPAGAVFGDYA